mmetsp:Transcript_35474/g.89154  ORF Transcript_35474/g.89154 Transcript_35474/m.89154 type:complete len:285 (+) Transcript_35474:590-1444(+)
MGRFQAKEATLVKVTPAFSNVCGNSAMLHEALAERHTGMGSQLHKVQSALRHADEPHAVVDTARPESALRNFKAAAFAEEKIACRHAHVHELDFCVAVRRIVVAKHGEGTLDVDAGCVHGDEDHGVLLVLRPLVRGRAPHEYTQTATLVHSTAGPPLQPIYHVMVAISDNSAFHVGCIRAGHPGLSHSVTGPDLAFQKWLQPGSLLRLGAVPDQHFHVSGVGRAAVEDLGAPWNPSHFFRKKSVFQVSQPCSILALWVGLSRKKHIPKSLPFCFSFQSFDLRKG